MMAASLGEFWMDDAKGTGIVLELVASPPKARICYKGSSNATVKDFWKSDMKRIRRKITNYNSYH